MDTHSRDAKSPQHGWGNFLLAFVLSVALGGVMYAVDPNGDLSWVGCLVLVLMISALSHLPRDYQLHRVVKAWLGIIAVIFTGGIIILALELGLAAYWATVYGIVAGVAGERVRLFEFQFRDLWAGKPEEDAPEVPAESSLPRQREGV